MATLIAEGNEMRLVYSYIDCPACDAFLPQTSTLKVCVYQNVTFFEYNEFTSEFYVSFSFLKTTSRFFIS